MSRLLKIDGMTRDAHHYLSSEDECFYFGDYAAYKDYSHSDTNQLIKNLKIKPSEIETDPRRDWHKQNAIAKCAQMFIDALRETYSGLLVPLPPSKARDDADYDDRILKMCNLIAQIRKGLKVHELVVQTKTIQAFHENSGQKRLKPDQLMKLFRIEDHDLVAKNAHCIVLVDDVLTTGSHFKAAKQLISNYIDPLKIPIVGFFVARTIHVDDQDL